MSETETTPSGDEPSTSSPASGTGAGKAKARRKPRKSPAKKPAAKKPAAAKAKVTPKVASSADFAGTPGPVSPTEQKILDNQKPFEGETPTERKLREMGLTNPR